MLKQLHVLFFSFLFVVPVFALETEITESPTYYDDRQHGWYWYEEEGLPEEKENRLPEIEV